MEKITISLKGIWHKITLNEAMTGKVGMLFFDYLKDKPADFDFYAVTEFAEHDYVNIFLGVDSNKPNLELTEYFHQIDSSDHPLADYEELIGSGFLGKQVLNGKINVSPIPIRIEHYVLKDNQLKVEKILIPVEIA